MQMQPVQSVKTTITMDAKGTLTVPEEARQALAIDGAVFMDLEVVDGSLVLRPGEAVPEEDLWAYTPEHIARVKRALQSPRDQDLRLTPEELERLAFGPRE
jgi:bifunctional DNA-binding transcriptional regulator/antitoxin component of YhaV-PrlF toxin-antitoxin module